MSCPLGRVGFLELVTFEPGLGERGSTRLQGPGALGRQREGLETQCGLEVSTLKCTILVLH